MSAQSNTAVSDARGFALIGFGDIAKRVAKLLQASGVAADRIAVFGRSLVNGTTADGLDSRFLDLDAGDFTLSNLGGRVLVYFVPPQTSGEEDLRSRALITAFTTQNTVPQRVVLISTTGVYGDSAGAWIDEQSATSPSTPRAHRRLDAEQQWANFCELSGVPIAVLRVPGIYSYSRIPRERLELATPVVRASECGYTNRIHADDLARSVVAACALTVPAETYNICDGSPSTINEYLQAAAAQLGLPALPEISMAEAQDVLSEGMLSYLGESRRISNDKMVNKLKVTPLYPDFKIGLRHS